MYVEAEVAGFASCRAGGGDAPVAGCGGAGGLGGHSASYISAINTLMQYVDFRAKE